MSLHTFLADPIPFQRWVTSLFARLDRHDDRECWRELWELHRQVPEGKNEDGRETQAVEDAFTSLKAAVVGGPQMHSRTATWLPANGQYVVFSDHHIAPDIPTDNNRHDYFKTFGNAKLYCRVLDWYNRKRFTLIENGDVEELVIFEPTLARARERGRLKIPDDLGKLEQLRAQDRLAQLKDVVASYAHYEFNYYRLIGETFLRDGRYVRTVGNHDDDVKQAAYAAVLQTAYGAPVTAKDYVFVEAPRHRPGTGPNASYMILHGNQFDRSTTPAIAPVSGELHSECLAWAYEGADRVWRWPTHAREWAVNHKPFTNRLVSDQPAVDIERATVMATERLATRLVTGQTLDAAEFMVLIQGLSDAQARALLEEIQGHVIAWEYLIGRDIGEKLSQVLLHREFFKYRHTNEDVIATHLDRWGDGGPPVMVIGHTHEVRDHALRPNNSPCATYVNCGTAGRFENLIWGVEIDQGAHRVVSWHFAEGPFGQSLAKLHWTPSGAQLVPVPMAI